MGIQNVGKQQAVRGIDLHMLKLAIEKQRLLFLAVSGLQAPGIDCNLKDDEILGLIGCIAETIDLIQDVIDLVEHAEPSVTSEDMRWQIEQQTFLAIHKDYTEPPLFDALNAEVLRLANLPESAGKKSIQILLEAKANIDKQGNVEG